VAISQSKALNASAFVGLSTDTKPTNVSAGDTFLETDTGNQFTWNGAWVQASAGSSFNRDNASLLTLTAQGTGTVNSADQVNSSGRGACVGINITVITAGTLTVVLQGKDVASGQYYTIASTAAITGTGFGTLFAYPGITPVTATQTTVAVSAPLPRTWRISATVATGPVTATIGASVID
jgi:hypothetical protein